MKEQNVIKKIQMALSKLPVRIFRNNTGMGWVGKTVSKKNEPGGVNIRIKNARPLHAGLCKGSSDLIGWTTVKVTDDMVGCELAIFTAIEVKVNKTDPSREQGLFLEAVRKAGGLSGVASNEADALDIATQLYE